MSDWWMVALGTYGAFLLVTSIGLGWNGVLPGPRRARTRRRLGTRARAWMDEAGLTDVSAVQFLSVTAFVGVLGATVGGIAFGGVLPPLGLGLFASTLPAAIFRHRRAERLAAAEELWPGMIEEIRILTAAAGRSVPHALFEVGRRSSATLRPAFEAAHREWLLTTDLRLSLDVLTSQLGSPTADALAETLLVAHELGATDLDRRLAEFAEDRRQEVQARKEARSRQAGVRFARRFVILVPAGMAAAGMSLGRGRAAYATTSGQLLVSLGVALVAACWVWSGSMLRLPRTERVFR